MDRATAEGTAVSEARLAALSRSSSDLQSGMAVKCQQKADLCLKQCKNAIDVASLDEVTRLNMNLRVCRTDRKKGDELQAQADQAADDAVEQSAHAALHSAEPSTGPAPASTDSADAE